MYVNDQDCNGYSTYAWMQFKRATGQTVDGDTCYWNSDSLCRGSGQTRNGPKFSDDFNITHGRVVVCQSDRGAGHLQVRQVAQEPQGLTGLLLRVPDPPLR
ncbi:hypothetical protein ACWGKK_44035, partial [Streptomyces chartreusis]